jgi:hypothetical protein
LAQAALAAVSGFSVAAPVGAAQLAIDASVSSRVEYNDNIPLSVVPEPGWRFNLAPTLSLSRRTESNALSARLGLSFNSYTNTKFNATDRFVSLLGTQQFDRDQLDLPIDYRRESTQASQLAATGINVGRTQVGTLSLSPQWTRSLTDKWSSSATATYTQAHYDHSEQANLTDYTTYGATLGLKYSASPRTTTGLSLAYSKFDTSPFTTRSESWALSGNGSYLWSERVTVSMSLGVQRVRTDQAQNFLICPADPVLCQLGLVAPVPLGKVGTSTHTEFPFNLSLRWEMSETETFTATASEQVNPLGTGTVASSTQFVATYNRALSPTLQLSISTIYTISSLLDGVNLGYYFTISPVLSWQIDEAWNANAGYSFSRTAYANTPIRADANVVFVSVAYAWPLLQRPY